MKDANDERYSCKYFTGAYDTISAGLLILVPLMVWVQQLDSMWRLCNTTTSSSKYGI